MKCPECESHIYGDKCRCGWTQPQEKEDVRRCAWNDYGQRCDNVGTISPALVGEGPWYCAFHYDCLKDADLLKDPMKRLEWHAQDRLYCKKYAQKDHSVSEIPPSDCSGKSCYSGCSIKYGWNPNDQMQLRGLAIRGPTSMTFKKAPFCMQQAALHLVKKGVSTKGNIFKSGGIALSASHQLEIQDEIEKINRQE